MSRSRADRASPDSASKLIKFLAEDREFTSIEIAETLWLAMQMEPAMEPSDEEVVDQSQTPSPQPLPSVAMDVEGDPELPSPPPPPLPRANIAASIPQAGVLPPQTLPVWLADPAMLTDSLAVIRALKPLLQKAEAGISNRLDEPATVDNIARTRLWLPVLEPKQEPLFDIILVVDRGSSMHIWQRLVKDITRILRRYGAFRDVQVFDLVVNQADQSSGHSKANNAVRLVSKPQRPGHRPSELIDQRGRRIVIVLSDCAGTYWWNGTLLPMLQEWGRIMPTVIWQMLPAWMWKRTALGRGTAVAVSSDIPGVANQRLKTRIQERDEPEDADKRIPVPVVTSEVRDLAHWSLMLAGDVREVTPGFLLPQQGGFVPRSKGIEEIAHDRAQQSLDEGDDIDPDAAFSEALEAIARERVDRFLELASPQAQQLIMLLAAAPVITLPVVRLIRDAMLYEAQSPLPVAEVFLSGLLLRLPGQEDDELERVLQEESERVEVTLDSQDLITQEEDELKLVQLDRQDLVQYDFAPKVRSVLLKTLPAVETIEVINSVSAAVERRWNRVSDQDFRAFLTNPKIQAPEGLEGLRSFASVTAEILEQLGGNYVNFARQLRQGAGEEPLPKPELEDVNFPDLEPFEFINAQLDAQLIDEAEAEPESTFPPPLQSEEFTVITVQLQPESEPERELEPFEFTVATLHLQSHATWQLRLKKIEKIPKWVIQRQQQRAYRFFESLPDDLSLEMVAIPAGTFLMGSPDNEPERSDRESSQHEVSVAPFFMSKYPVTQAQWKAVAALPQVSRELDPDPSYFKGDKRPVEQVSWYDAVEFCERLSAYTEQTYRLPTEAEWEYACRAGTTTPFHFGDMVTTQVANYDGNYIYNEGSKGGSRSQTTPIDQFEYANVFGLLDMHGNVWEWCQDHWHNNYEGAPIDGSAWLTKNKSPSRVRRGGSWDNLPRFCRSAYRDYFSPDDRDDAIGFRVVCSAP
jgi:formylglycine-generating enzyme required for sulfatase activity